VAHYTDIIAYHSDRVLWGCIADFCCQSTGVVFTLTNPNYVHVYAENTTVLNLLVQSLGFCSFWRIYKWGWKL